MSTEELIELFHHRWAAPALALLGERGGARFVELQRRLDVGRESLRRALDALVESGLARRNEGYGHPLRPEYVLTAKGRTATPVAAGVVAAGDPDALLRKWSVPVLAELGEERRFSELRAASPGSRRARSRSRSATSRTPATCAARYGRRGHRRRSIARPRAGAASRACSEEPRSLEPGRRPRRGFRPRLRSSSVPRSSSRTSARTIERPGARRRLGRDPARRRRRSRARRRRSAATSSTRTRSPPCSSAFCSSSAKTSASAVARAPGSDTGSSSAVDLLAAADALDEHRAQPVDQVGELDVLVAPLGQQLVHRGDREDPVDRVARAPRAGRSSSARAPAGAAATRRSAGCS